MRPPAPPPQRRPSAAASRRRAASAVAASTVGRRDRAPVLPGLVAGQLALRSRYFTCPTVSPVASAMLTIFSPASWWASTSLTVRSACCRGTRGRPVRSAPAFASRYLACFSDSPSRTAMSVTVLPSRCRRAASSASACPPLAARAAASRLSRPRLRSQAWRAASCGRRRRARGTRRPTEPTGQRPPTPRGAPRTPSSTARSSRSAPSRAR